MTSSCEGGTLDTKQAGRQLLTPGSADSLPHSGTNNIAALALRDSAASIMVPVPVAVPGTTVTSAAVALSELCYG